MQALRHALLRHTSTVAACAAATASVGLGTTSPLLGNGTADMAAAQEPENVVKARAAIAKAIEESVEKRGDGTSIGPTFVRLAWHSAGTYSKADGSGGSTGGRMKFDPEKSDGANAGLSEARDVVEAIAAEAALSRADAYTLSGVVAVEEMGGPKVKWAPGRADENDGAKSPAPGRLPNADMGSLRATAQHLRDIFYRMGFTDRDIVALSGAHTVGRCHVDASGYWGPWQYAETSFNNEYFRLLIEGGPWTIKTTHEGKPWTGPDQFETPDGALMMLPSDMALLWDKDFRKVVEEYAKDEDLFFKDFATAFAKLLDLGVTRKTGTSASKLPGFLSGILSWLGL